MDYAKNESFDLHCYPIALALFIEKFINFSLSYCVNFAVNKILYTVWNSSGLLKINSFFYYFIYTIFNYWYYRNLSNKIQVHKIYCFS